MNQNQEIVNKLKRYMREIIAINTALQDRSYNYTEVAKLTNKREEIVELIEQQ